MMATEDEKRQRLNKVFNIGMYSLISGLWDMLGTSSFATTRGIGEKILEALEREAGVTIKGDTPEQILNQVSHLLSEEVGTMSAGAVKIDEHNNVEMVCKNCFLQEATGWLEREGVQPFACIPMNIAAAAMRKELGLKHRLTGRVWNEADQTCTIQFALIKQ